MATLLRRVTGAIVRKAGPRSEVKSPFEVFIPKVYYKRLVYHTGKVASQQQCWPFEAKAHERSRTEPVKLGSNGGHVYWVFREQVHSSDDSELTSMDVLALINEAANRRRLQLEKAHALQAMTDQLDQRGKRERIPQDVKVTVWQRDGGRCVECGSQQELEFDHIIPLAMGGSNTMRNLQLLCAVCNCRKGATLG